MQDIVFYFINDLTIFLIAGVVILGVVLVTAVILITECGTVTRCAMLTNKSSVTHTQLVIYSLILYGLLLSWVFYNTGEFTMFKYGLTNCFTLGGLFSGLIFLLALVIFLISTINIYAFSKLEELLLYLVLGLIGPVFFTTINLIGFFIGLEIISFTFYILLGSHSVAFSQQSGQKQSFTNRAAESALRYLIPGLFSSLLILVGLVIIYLQIPTFDIIKLKTIISYDALVYNNSIDYLGIELGLGCVLASFLFKLTVAPFHRWVFGTYSGAPLYVVLLISSIAKLIYFIGFIRLVWPLLELTEYHTILAAIGLFSIGIGTAHGIYEQRFNLILACSGILNIGYVIVSLALGGQTGVTLSVFSLLVYVYLILGFTALIHYTKQQSTAVTKNLTTVSNLGEWKTENGASTVGLIIITFALVGIPPLVGFFPKFFIFINLVLRYPLLLSWGFMIGVTVSAFIYLRWIIRLMTTDRKSDVNDLRTTLTWFTKRTNVIIITLVLLCGWSLIVDNILVVATLCSHVNAINLPI